MSAMPFLHKCLIFSILIGFSLVAKNDTASNERTDQASLNNTRDANIRNKCDCAPILYLQPKSHLETAAIECGKKPNLRIVNGKITKPHAYPWMVAIQFSDGIFCGGSLINDRYVLTAGHCTNGKKQAIVLLGAHSLRSTGSKPSVHKSKRIVTHQNFYGYPALLGLSIPVNDIGLIELEKPIGKPRHVGPICLPLDEENFTDKEALVTGWGATKEDGNASKFLRETTIKIVSDDYCQRKFEGELMFEAKSMLCGLGEDTDACQGDSGGPMFLEKSGRYEQIGIVSWGVGCARPDLPAAYTRLGEFRQWIIDNTQNAEYCS